MRYLEFTPLMADFKCYTYSEHDSVSLFYSFFKSTSFRDNRTPGTRSAMDATQKHTPDSVHKWGWVRLSGTGWCPLLQRGTACEIGCWDRMGTRSGPWLGPAAGGRDSGIRAYPCV